jgi:peptide/nickel transport system permease protein
MTTAASALSLKKTTKESGTEESQFRVVLRRFMRHRAAVFSTVLILLIFVVSLLAPVITPFERDGQNLSLQGPLPPGAVDGDGLTHVLGVDNLGRDLFTRLIYAGRISLTIAIVVTLISEVIGMILGAAAGYYKGWVDSTISRVIEFMLTVPTLPILLIVSAILLKGDSLIPIPQAMINGFAKLMLSKPVEAEKVIILMIILIVFGWLGAARLMRGMALSLAEQDFVQSLKALGASDARIIFRHIIPNGLSPILVDASLSIGGVIITEAALSFLGLGVQDPTPTWGNMLNNSQSYMFQHPWLPLIPGIPLVLVSLCFNFIGDGLRDALDPRLKR